MAIYRSTKEGNPRVARQTEAAHRTTRANGEVEILAVLGGGPAPL